MVRERVHPVASRGFSLAELLIVLAITAILATLSIPAFMSYWKNATLKGGAQELVANLNTVRQLAIAQNTSVCVTSNTTSSVPGYGTKLQLYLSATCTGTAWATPPVTDSSGAIALATAVVVKAPTNGVAFSFLGSANPAGTWDVCNPNDTTQHAQVTVSASGRLSIGYPTSAC